MPNNYLPIPPRAWSRVQNGCTYTVPGSTYSQAYIPLTNQTVSQAQANYEDKLIYKGNILQYKGNSSQLTRSQKYAQLAKGLGPARTKVFATQGITYTNPNTTGLLRVGSVNVPFPNQIVGQPNNISGPFQYDVPNPFDCSGNSLQEGGTLVCGTYANPCSGEIIKQTSGSGPLCFPSYCSDVPGTPIELCWNPKVQTWFPRQRYTMNNSTNKWPQGYKGLVSAETPVAPVLTLDSYTETSVTLSWITNDNVCLPISSFRIYQNGVLINIVPYPIMSTTIYNLVNCVNYTFYVTAVSNTIESLPSNSVSNSLIPSPPTILSCLNTSCGQIKLTWTPAQTNCLVVTSWEIYQNGVFYTSVSPVSILTYIINGLTINSTYSYYIISNSNGILSNPSNTVNITVVPPYTATGSYYLSGAFLYFTDTGSITCNSYYSINVEYTLVGGGGNGSGGSDNGWGVAAGGGGAILNTSSPITMSFGSIWNISIGAGGTIQENTPGQDTNISNGYIQSTNNATYSGQGGRGYPDLSGLGGGGPGGGITSANGGIYNPIYFTGTGGAAGSLVIVGGGVTLPVAGGNSDVTLGASGGNGSSGFPGIDGIYYGGGGGGGGNEFINGPSSQGLGGLGGGGSGGYAIISGTTTTLINPTPGTPNTGGGGGGVIYDSSTPSGIGGSGIAIFRITC